MKGSELLIIEITGVKNTPSKISTHLHPRLRLYIFRFLFLTLFEKCTIVSCEFKSNSSFILLLRRDAARLLDVSHEGRARPAVCRPRPDILGSF